MREWKKWPIEKIESSSPLFPKDLLSINPVIKKLYFRGYWDKTIFEKSLGVVGSRRMTGYGKVVIEKLMPDLVSAGMTIISGFMYGVDSEAHYQSLENGGRTVAVLGGGLDYLLPEENDKLYTQILESKGLVISEYEKDFVPTLWSFPQRNRIVCGLSCLGVLVIEAGMESGSLITARLAEKQGKKVFAIPGPITTKVSMGTNWLIATGKAKMVTMSSDILGNGGVNSEQIGLFSDLDISHQKVVELLADEPLTIDELAKKTGKNVAEMMGIVSIITLRGIITETEGKFRLTI